MKKTSDANPNVTTFLSSTASSVEQGKSRLGPAIIEVFRAITKNDTVEFNPRLSDHGRIIYPELSLITGVENFQANEILEQLYEEEILTREPASLLCRCPACNTEVAILSLVCPNCGGTDLESGTAMQHLPCLHFDFESNFVHYETGEIYCPKCERKLNVQGSDYLTPGTFFKCASCGEFTTRAKRLCSCPTCQQVSETSKEPPIEAYKYRVRRDTDFKNLRSLEVSTLIQELQKVGLDAAADASLKGTSGSMHSFSLIVKTPGKVSSMGGRVTNSRVAVDIVVGGTQVDPNRVFALFAKAVDCGLANRVLAAATEISKQTKLLAESYGIHVLEWQNTAGAAELLCDHIRSIFEEGKVAKEIKRTTKRRGSIDVMADILSVVVMPSSKSEIISCANLSFEQCQRYLYILERMGLLGRYLEDAIRVKYVITERGREYMRGLSGEFGRIAEGDKSIWRTRRRLAQSPTA